MSRPLELGSDALRRALDESTRALHQAAEPAPELSLREIGRVVQVGAGIARVRGLPGIGAEELIELPGGLLALALDLEATEIGAVLLGEGLALRAGAPARRTRRVADVPVGRELLGRVIDASGAPRDGGPRLAALERWPIERPAPPISARAPVIAPLHTGIKVVDALIPIGRGQRELILGDRQIGKTSIAVDTILAQQPGDVVSVYCAIGQRATGIAQVVGELRRGGALGRCVVVASSADDPPGLQFITPYAAMTLAEWFMERGGHALLVLDDLTRHARAYRQLSLLLRRPPGREAYPGDVFYLHSRLLERATQLRAERGGGSLTALPIVELEEQNVAAYIPTNLISISDGQLHLSPELFRKGLLPAVDVGKSVSRVGGRAQPRALREVAASARIAYAQFEELESFSRFSTRLDPETRRTIERGRRLREVLKQPRRAPLSPGAQIAVLLATLEGLFDRMEVPAVVAAEAALLRGLAPRLAQLDALVKANGALAPEQREDWVRTAHEVLSAAGAGAEEDPWNRPSC
jgi:F-type H+-transporting ATPase subunit alpha